MTTPRTFAERIDEIDRMLFEAQVRVLASPKKSDRAAADAKITEARIALDKMRSRVE